MWFLFVHFDEIFYLKSFVNIIRVRQKGKRVHISASRVHVKCRLPVWRVAWHDALIFVRLRK